MLQVTPVVSSDRSLKCLKRTTSHKLFTIEQLK